MQSIFLETTINADRHFQTTKRREKIEKQLCQKRLVTSAFVIGELRYNFLRNSTVLYNLLVEEKNVANALKRLGTYLHSTRQFDRVLKVFTYLAEKVDYDCDELAERLDILIEDCMDALFLEDIDEIIDAVDCIRRFTKPTKVRDRWVFVSDCKQNPKPSCRIVDFINDNLQSFKEVKSLPEFNGKDFDEHITKVLENTKKKYGTNCWMIGDVVISIECPVECYIYTTNIKDYRPICELLGKTLYQEI